jgi:hypothetical protein
VMDRVMRAGNVPGAPPRASGAGLSNS